MQTQLIASIAKEVLAKHGGVAAHKLGILRLEEGDLVQLLLCLLPGQLQLFLVEGELAAGGVPVPGHGGERLLQRRDLQPQAGPLRVELALRLPERKSEARWLGSTACANAVPARMQLTPERNKPGFSTVRRNTTLKKCCTTQGRKAKHTMPHAHTPRSPHGLTVKKGLHPFG